MDEEEFEVKPAISRSLLLFGFDEKNRKRDGVELVKENTNKVKTIIEFDNITNSVIREYNYNNNNTILSQWGL